MAKMQEPEMTREQILAAPVGGKTVAEWDTDWVHIKNGFRETQKELTGLLGLYRAILDDQTKYIGESVQINEGLKKRLRDYSRKSDSSRDHYGAERIFENRDKVECEILVIGVDDDAVGATQELKALMIALYEPQWNVNEEGIATQRRASYRAQSQVQKIKRD